MHTPAPRIPESFASQMSNLYHLRNMLPDGACFFRAMAAGMWENPEMHAIVRAKAIAYMKENPEQFAAYLVDNPEAYLDKMQLSTTWTDNLAMQAVADCFDIAIVVIRLSGEPTYTVTPVRFARGIDVAHKVTCTVHVAYDGVHYNYLLPNAELRQQDARHACSAHERQIQNHPQALLDAQFARQLQAQEARPWSWWDMFAWR
jgi:hypothetical protein